MTKKDMVKAIADDVGLLQGKVQKIIQRLLDGIIETLLHEGRIELRNFGVFEVKKRRARKARNPRTGERVSVPAKRAVTFKPGLEMEQRVNRLQGRLRQK